MGAFHAYDIRGVYNLDFNKEDVYKIGYFLPELLHTKRVLVGRDCRVSSPEIHEALLAGLVDAGATVFDLGLSTTPMVYFGTARYGFDASVQITASHNPREYNGMKISRTGAMPVGLETGLGQLQEWIQTRTPECVGPKGHVEAFDIKEDYLNFFASYGASHRNLKVGFDLSNGMSCLFAKALFGMENRYYINDYLDGSFPAHEPNPLVPENVRQLQDLVKRESCDLGIIFDGDADRVMFTDENGTFISPDLMIALLGHWFLDPQRKPAGEVRVLQDIRSSKAIGEYLAPMGGVMHTWRVGRAFAAPKLREIDGLFGGELAGHYYFKDFFYSDSGLLAALLVLNVTAAAHQKGIKISRLIARIRRYESSGEINFKIQEKQKAMEALRTHFCALEAPAAFMDFDGYRIEFPEWWFNVRPSNTEPYLRFIAEASSAPLLEEKISQMREVLKPFED